MFLQRMGSLVIGLAALGLLAAGMPAAAQTPPPAPSAVAPQSTAAPANPAASPAAAATPTFKPLPGVHEISIRNIGQSNAASKGHEVWLLWTKGIEVRHATTMFKAADGWFERDGNIISTDASGALTFKGELDGVDALVFFRHPWSGRAEVTINGQRRDVDLYASESGQLTLPLNGGPVSLDAVVGPDAPPALAPSPTTAPTAPSAPVSPASAPAASGEISVWVWAAALGALLVIGIGAFFFMRPRRK